jgi:hypothetical protein
MSDNVNNIILEHLRAIRSDIAKLSEKVDNLTRNDVSTKQHLSAFMGQESVQDSRLALLDMRLERIERRLELVDNA